MKKALISLLLCICLVLPLGALGEIHPLPVDQSGGYPVSRDNMVGDFEYQDESIHVIKHENERFKKASCFWVEIFIEDPTQLRTAMTADRYDTRKYVPTKTLAKSKNSVLAINGDFFKYNDYGYLVRQGVTYRDFDLVDSEHDLLIIDENSDFHLVQNPTPDSARAAVEQLEAEGHQVINTFNFGPTLVLDGQALEDINTSLYQGRYKMMRLAIGQLGEKHYAVYFCYGTTDGKEGLSLPNFAEYIASVTPEVKIAFNLDGGGSTHVVLLQTQLHKNPSGRDICDILYFCSASDQLGEERAK